MREAPTRRHIRPSVQDISAPLTYAVGMLLPAGFSGTKSPSLHLVQPVGMHAPRPLMHARLWACS
jgi:hypothetical protein